MPYKRTIVAYGATIAGLLHIWHMTVT